MKWKVKVFSGTETVEADRYHIENGGTLVLLSGHPFEPRLIKAYNARVWCEIQPVIETEEEDND